jgi:hypothetical protein
MMDQSNFTQWKSMASAPRDGARILVAIRSSEQGPAEVDVVRWTRAELPGEEFWIATDSDPACRVAYAEAELTGWMPLPSPLPRLRSAPDRSGDAETATPDEIDGSAI